MHFVLLEYLASSALEILKNMRSLSWRMKAASGYLNISTRVYHICSTEQMRTDLSFRYLLNSRFFNVKIKYNSLPGRTKVLSSKLLAGTLSGLIRKSVLGNNSGHRML